MGSIRLLLIDDDRVDRKVIRRSLSGQYLVTEAETLAKGRRLLAEPRDFDCVVLDYRLPDGTAVDFLIALQEANPGVSPVPVVVVTGAEGDRVGLESLARGAQDYLFKEEVNSTSLPRSIRYAIERHQLLLSIQERDRKLQHSRRMEAIGQLAGGVAHDFNNLLSVIMGYTELAIHGHEQGKPIGRYLEAVHASGQRASELTSQLLSLGRKQLLKPQVIDLNSFLERVSQLLLSQVVSNDVRIEFVPERGLPLVRVDPAQTEQALLNLGLNARDAMPEGGVLTLSTRALTLSGTEKGFARSPKPGAYVSLTVSDTGVGMDPSTLGRVFEPFFTTKVAGRGTGLGLASVNGFVQQSGGYLLVESEVGVGTLFQILLPAVNEPLAANDLTSSGIVVPGRTTKMRVLVAEDEPQVRALCEEALRTAEFEVVAAANGREALELYCAEEGAFDLVISDVMMPEMGGVELAGELSSRDPNLPVLLMSGYAEDPRVRKALAGVEVDLIPKPITPTVLIARAERCLARAQRKSRA